MASAADILRLPPELVLRVSSNLNTPDLGAFRRTCKQIETNLFESFAREFFTKRQFMIEHVSLAALVGIANHKTLAPYLTEVIIGCDYLSHHEQRSYPHLERDLSGQIERGMFTETGQARDMLVDAFSNLPNLRTVGLRDYNGTGRYRDGETALWRSYGWSTGLSEEDLRITGRETLKLGTATPDFIFPLLLFALGQAASRPAHINVFLRGQRLPDKSFNVLAGYMYPKVEPVLSKLRTLLLSLNDSVSVSSHDAPHDNLKRFLRHTPVLEHLRLNFRPGMDANTLLEWLGPPLHGSVQLQYLTTLDLGLLSADPAVLLPIISKFPLTSLSFWKVSLQPRDALGLLPDSNTWSLFLKRLGNFISRPSEFKTLMIGYPVDGSRTTSWVRDAGAVKFASRITTDANGEKVFEDLQSQVTYRKHFGSDVRTWLEDLALRTHLPDQSGQEDDSSDESEEEDSDLDAVEEIIDVDDDDEDA
ncbi:hypothetical protein LTR37_006463 [Vermiconidia calcicola]|uniref:Uncharacterized protein n=1 Tax=Vermiconidia calcicola TaxID=1690605 RepID=A0ACC3NGF2_9PEZI|nr:hypothetical protein LTR37_006463 [Vermiconidia calcicola]